MRMAGWMLIAGALAADATAQTTSVELDHVYIAVPMGGRAERTALEQAGFTLTSPPQRHEGQGTSSVSVLFGNACIELIWIDPTVGVESRNRGALELMRSAAAWRESGASPFGVGLRRGEGPFDYPNATQRTAAWMRPGTSVDVLRQEEEPDAVEVIVVPDYMAITGWADRMQRDRPELFRHRAGGELLTGVEIRGPASHRPLALQSLGVNGLRFTEAAEPLMVVRLDGGSGERIDLRPALPLVIVR